MNTIRLIITTTVMLNMSIVIASDGSWKFPAGATPPLDGVVNTIAVSGSEVIVGGTFTNAGGIPDADNIAVWDGLTWSALGSGLNGTVHSIVIDGANVYAAGEFSDAGGIASADNIAKWNGSTWEPLGATGLGPTNPIRSIVLDGPSVYVGGRFNNLAGNSDADYVAKWNGASWESVGAGLNADVFDLALNGGELIVVGSFVDAGSNPNADRVAKWNGTNWESFGSGLDAICFSVAVIGTNVYVGGEFINADGIDDADYLVKWNGSNWEAVGTINLNNAPYSLVVDGSNLFVGGHFNNFGSPSRYIMKWNGAAWEAIPGINDYVWAIAVSGSNVYVGGRFVDAGGTAEADYVARLNGNVWYALTSVPNGDVYAIEVSGDTIIVGGKFSNALSDTNADAIILWDGISWKSLGPGLRHGAFEASVYDICIANSSIYVCGVFLDAGGDPDADYIARWNGSTWESIGGPGSGLPTTTVTIAVNGADVYAGGFFSNAGGNADADKIAKWNGVSWEAMGGSSILGTPVNAIAISGSDVYVGGSFSSIIGVQNSRGIAKWNGSGWEPLGAGVSGGVEDIEIVSGEIYVAGSFQNAGENANASRVAKWNGSDWTAFGSGIDNGVVIDIVVSGSYIYAAGSFVNANGNSSLDRIAIWKGSSWSDLSAGADSTVNAIGVRGYSLFVGGQFATIGNLPISRFAMWRSVIPEPSSQPTNLEFTNRSPMSVTASFIGNGSDGYLVLRKSGSLSTFIPVDSMLYVRGQIVGDATVAYSGSSVSFIDSVLLAGTQYYYTIYAFNGSGVMSNYYVLFPAQGSASTLVSEPSAQPTNLVFSDVSFASCRLTFTASSANPDGYLVLRKMGFPVTETPVDGAIYAAGDSIAAAVVTSVGQMTTFKDSNNLVTGTTYYYAIFSYNGEAETQNYLSSLPLVGIVTTLVDNAVPLIVPVENTLYALPGQATSISAAVTDNFAIESVSLSYRTGIETAFTSIAMVLNSNGFYSATIPAGSVNSSGLIYRIVANDAAGNTDTSSGTLRIQFQTGDIRTDNTPGSSYTDGIPFDVWRMISVPVILDTPIVSAALRTLGSTSAKTWKLFDGQQDVSTIAQMKPGKGYWFKQILLGGGVPIILGSARTISGSESQITLQPGWNQIGNPFTFPIDWITDTDAGNNPNIKGPVKYDGSKYIGIGQTDAPNDPTLFTQLLPWDGYWVYNASASPVVLTIDPTRTLGKNITKSRYADMDWKMEFKVRSGEQEDAWNYIGTAADASDGEDVYDIPEVPVIGDYVSVSFDHNSAPYTIDVRQTNSDGHVWIMRAKANVKTKESILEYAGNLPQGYLMRILDVSNNTEITKSGFSYRQRIDMETIFKIFVGKPAFVDQEFTKAKSELPSEFALSQNYPNPFNPTTSIRYELAKASHVVLEIYNALGQRVRLLVSAEQLTGSYEVVWDGRSDAGKSLATGVYIYRLNAGGVVRTRKMLLLK